MYIDYLSDEQICDFIDKDIQNSENAKVHRNDGAKLDLMADLFAGYHSRDDKYYLYQIKKIDRNLDCIFVHGYAVRVNCPGRESGKGNIWNGEFTYQFNDVDFDKYGNISLGGFAKKNYIKFIYAGLPEDKKKEFKKLYLESVVKEAESFLDC